MDNKLNNTENTIQNTFIDWNNLKRPAGTYESSERHIIGKIMGVPMIKKQKKDEQDIIRSDNT